MTAEAYAQALWQIISAGGKPKSAVASLCEVLAAHGRSALLPRIGRSFARIALQETQKNSVVLTVAHEKDVKSAQKEIAVLLEARKIEKEDVKTAVDSNLSGGWRLQGRGELVDASYKKHLISIYESVLGK